MNPKISVIIPAYNAEKTLRRCLESVFSQDLEALEVILVNDGSNDRTLEIAGEYKCFTNFILIDQTNGGAARARWAGITRSRGDYLAFVDADDYVAPDMLSAMFAKAAETGADIVICGWYRVSGDRVTQALPYQGLIYESGIRAAQRITLEKHGTSSLWNKLLKKELICETDYEKTFDVTNSEDNLLLALTMPKASKVCYLNRALYYSVENPDSVTQNPTLRRMRDKLDVETFLFTHFTSSKNESLIKTAYFCHFLILRKMLLYLNNIDKANEFTSIKIEIKQRILSLPRFHMTKFQKSKALLDMMLIKAGLFDSLYLFWRSPYFAPMRKIKRGLMNFLQAKLIQNK